MVSVFQGQADSLGKRLDPFEDAWFSLTGSEAMGPGWSVTASGNTLVVGAPDLGAVLIFHLEGRQEGILGGQALVLPDLLDDQDDTRLGASVLTMDMDSDGQRKLLVTAPVARGEGDAVKAGRLYVFETSGHFARPLFDTAIPPQLGTDDAGLTVLGANAYDKSGSQISACGDFDGDGLGEVAFFGAAALHDTGLVEMDMGLDEARRQQPPIQVQRLALGGEARLNGLDAPVRDADIERAAVAARQHRVLEDEVHQRNI